MSSAIHPSQTSANHTWANCRGNFGWKLPSQATISENSSGQEKKAHLQNWFGSSGLPTPPAAVDMTAVALQHQANDRHSSLPYQPPRYPLQDVSNPGFAPQIRRNSNAQVPSRPNEKHDSPSTMNHSRKESNGHQPSFEQKDEIATYLQIPESVNQSKGSLAEFAAEITCLFWFESASTLQYAEAAGSISQWEQGLVPDAIPSIGFRKWVTTILTTTQVSKEVILLALMFIFRLKKFEPTVSGKRGSEFRLLTVALMLGNKFLDDNTYTNKTWAEVSGISVTEIHIMEVEFLSNMRYELYVSKNEWNSWNRLLGQFGAFYQQAARKPRSDFRSSAPVTPVSQTFPHKLPSPPATHHVHSTYSSQIHAPTLPNPLTTLPHLPRSPVRQQRNTLLEQLERKRSMDFISTDLPPTKRFHQSSHSTSGRMSASHTPTGSVYTPTALPTLTTDTVTIGMGQMNSQMTNGIQLPLLPMPRIETTRSLSAAHLAPLSLPTSRAMSTVYSQPASMSSQPPTPVSAGPSAGGLNLAQNAIPNLMDGSRQHSNYASANASPASTAYNSALSRPGLSPSYFLTNRSSPYRPVRGVNTLLIPPPSASMQNLARNVALDQIHYQPLAKAGAETRRGPVPYIDSNNWYQASQPTASHTTPQRSYWK